jgi:hypothetical protein
MLELPGIEYVSLAAAVSAAAFAAFVLMRGTRGIATWSFVAGFLLVALQELALFLALRGEEEGMGVGWVRVATGARMMRPIPWLIFGLTFGEENARERLWAWRGSLLVLGALGLAGIGLLPSGGMLKAVRAAVASGTVVVFGPLGVGAHLVVIVGVAGVLVTLESILREARRGARGRVKHLVIGLFALFAAEIYAIGNFLLFWAVQSEVVLLESAGILVSTVFVAQGVLRRRLFAVDVFVSRHVLYRSATVGLVGGYLLLLGLAGEALRRFEIPMRSFFLGVGAFVALLGLVAVLFSEQVRRRLKLYIDTHFYRDKHDYRRRWTDVTRNLGSAVRLDEVLRGLLETLLQAVWVKGAGVFLANGGGGDLVLARGAGLPVPAGTGSSNGDTPRIRKGGPLYASLEAGRVVELGPGRDGEDNGITGLGLVLVAPMQGSEGLMGALAVTGEYTGKPFTAEDRDLLATIARQASTAIQTARLSQDLATAKSMEAVHRVATFLLHDLKNCASVMSMVAEHAKKHMGDPEFQREAIEAVASTAPKMRALIAKLSGLRSVPEMEREPMEVESVVEETLAEIRKGLNGRVALKEDLRPTPQVLGDHEHIARVVTNLVVNAVEAVGEAGEVSVETYAEGPWACIRVRDTGPGIPEGHLRNGLFQPFRSTKPGGLGVGLYQCKTVVEAHGGHITVASTEGAGATFTVYLPIAPGAP